MRKYYNQSKFSKSGNGWKYPFWGPLIPKKWFLAHGLYVPRERGSCLMQLSDNLNHNTNFSEADLAVQAVVLNAVNVRPTYQTYISF
jgi:hypothetical protein